MYIENQASRHSPPPHYTPPLRLHHPAARKPGGEGGRGGGKQIPYTIQYKLEAEYNTQIGLCISGLFMFGIYNSYAKTKNTAER